MLRKSRQTAAFPFWLFVLMMAMLGALVVLTFLAMPQLRSAVGLPPADVNKLELSWEMLHTEQLSFLTTARQECRINLDHEEATWSGGRAHHGQHQGGCLLWFRFGEDYPG